MFKKETVSLGCKVMFVILLIAEIVNVRVFGAEIGTGFKAFFLFACLYFAVTIFADLTFVAVGNVAKKKPIGISPDAYACKINNATQKSAMSSYIQKRVPVVFYLSALLLICL